MNYTDDNLFVFELVKIKSNKQWASTKVSAVEEILGNNVYRYKSLVKIWLWTFKQSSTFVETTYNTEWGSCLDRDRTQNTNPDHWPNKNWVFTRKKFQKMSGIEKVVYILIFKIYLNI